jgi:hypothetical protein
MVPQLSMERIKFQEGKQRKFLKIVLEKTNCPNLRAFTQFGLDIPYSTLKNYFTEKRTLPKNIFKELCKLAKIDSTKLKIEYLKKNWGQIKGGKISKK